MSRSLRSLHAWPDDNQRIRRQATALAMLGTPARCLHAEKGSLDANNKARFANYVQRHQALGGPDQAIVETWRRFVVR